MTINNNNPPFQGAEKRWFQSISHNRRLWLVDNFLLSKHSLACETGAIKRRGAPPRNLLDKGREPLVIRTIMAILLLAGAVNAASAQSEAAVAQWPDRPIRFIVPFPAGAATDVVARIVAQRMGARLGQTVVVENRVGASGNI